jgi:hypothetical protein
MKFYIFSGNNIIEIDKEGNDNRVEFNKTVAIPPHTHSQRDGIQFILIYFPSGKIQIIVKQ